MFKMVTGFVGINQPQEMKNNDSVQQDSIPKRKKKGTKHESRHKSQKSHHNHKKHASSVLSISQSPHHNKTFSGASLVSHISSQSSQLDIPIDLAVYKKKNSAIITRERLEKIKEKRKSKVKDSKNESKKKFKSKSKSRSRSRSKHESKHKSRSRSNAKYQSKSLSRSRSNARSTFNSNDERTRTLKEDNTEFVLSLNEGLNDEAPKRVKGLPAPPPRKRSKKILIISEPIPMKPFLPPLPIKIMQQYQQMPCELSIDANIQGSANDKFNLYMLPKYQTNETGV